MKQAESNEALKEGLKKERKYSQLVDSITPNAHQYSILIYSIK